MSSVVPVEASDNVSENRRGRTQSDVRPTVCSCVFKCRAGVCAYLQVVVVSPAAAVCVLGGALGQVENRAEVTEIP